MKKLSIVRKAKSIRETTGAAQIAAHSGILANGCATDEKKQSEY